MIRKWKCILLLAVLFRCCTHVNGEDYQLLLNDNSPVTTGSTVTLNATVIDGSGRCATGVLTYRYEDDAFPIHKYEIEVEKCEALFHIPFNTTLGPSTYRYQVDVLHQLLPFIKRPIANGRGQLIVTENLNGQLLIYQNNVNISTNSAQVTYVSSSSEVLQKVVINAADYEYLNKSANSVVVYWFIDCVYKGNTTDTSNFTFSSNYTQSDIQHEILGIVVANFGPPPTPKPILTIETTPSPNDTTSTTTTTAAVTADEVSHVVADASNLTATTSPPEIDLISSLHAINSTYTSECQQKKHVDLLLSAVQLENQQKYGYFSRLLLVKDPISNFKMQGKVWIQEGEMLNLQMSCNGSGPFRYCAHYVQGPYNITGNETCTWDRNLVQCQMQFFHYFREPTNYTLVIIIANDVSKIVTPIGINIYKVQKQPQISVIVVPVTFSSIAVIIIVFGIAYYFQNRSRYMVEVADFDFANNSDMEYKTFRERLRDAISQAINRTQDYSEYDGSEEHIGDSVTPQNQKYGSMQ